MALLSKNDLKTFNFLVLCIVLLGIVSALQNIHIIFAPPHKKVEVVEATPPPTYIPQFVLISFDGSRSVDIWRNIRTFKDEMKSAGKALNVTHFINAAYFLTEETKSIYKGPRHELGTSNIGFSEDIEHLRQRIEEVNKAVVDGDEIAPHTVGHFSGTGWTKEEWKEELDSFDRIMFNLDQIYPGAGLPKLALQRKDIVGFRAPYLDKSPGLYEMLHEDRRYLYDSSEVGIGDEWPTKDSSGLWHIPLGTIFLGENKIPVLAMDYNLYVHHSQAHDEIKKGSPEWNRAYAETLAAFLEYFNRNYTASRAPVLVGYHFEDWNDDVYWEVMKDFAREVCGKPEVRCGTFKELVKYMEKNGVPKK